MTKAKAKATLGKQRQRQSIITSNFTECVSNMLYIINL